MSIIFRQHRQQELLDGRRFKKAIALFDEAFQILLDGVGGPSDRSGPDLGIEWQTFDCLIYMLQ